MIEREIQEYILKRSKGVCKISFQDARHIINLVTGKAITGMARAELYRYNGCNGVYEKIRVMATTNEVIANAVSQALKDGPVMDFYRYDLYNSDGEFEGKIFTIKNNLF